MIDRAKYYVDYYNCKKWIYRERYLQKRWAQERTDEMFKPYGSEEKYYRKQYHKFCNYTPLDPKVNERK